MPSEIEAKFLKVNFKELRRRLSDLGATCDHPMRLMRRLLFDFPDNRFQKNNQSQWLRIRDEGDKIAVNYKAKNKSKYAYELEAIVESFDDMSNLFKAIGLVPYSFQESKRETWKYNNVEVVLDEWPWLEPYIEIEGPSEQAIQMAAKDLGFDWRDACFGSVDTAYRRQYPGMKDFESISNVGDVHFGKPLPIFLKERQ